MMMTLTWSVEPSDREDSIIDLMEVESQKQLIVGKTDV